MMRLVQFETMMAKTMASTTRCRTRKSKEGTSRRVISRMGQWACQGLPAVWRALQNHVRGVR